MNAGRYCASCGTPHQAAARFCAKCGAPLAAETAHATARPSAAPPAPRAVSPPARHGPPWVRITAIGLVIVIVAGIALVLAAPSPEPDAQRLGLGTATAKAPAAERLVKSETWGTAPADQVLVLLRPGSTRADADRIARELGASVVGEIAWLGLYQLETAGRTAAALDEAVAKAGKVDGVTLALANAQVLAEDAVGSRCDPLADPSYRLGANARAYEVIGLRQAIDLLRGSGVALQPVRVGVLDDAIAKGTGEFSRDVRVSGDATDAASWDHGTEVAGLIGATFGNGGVAGVAGALGDKLTIGAADIYRPGGHLPKVLVPNPADPTQVTLAGQTHVYGVFADAVRQIDQGATVVNMSFGSQLGGLAGAKDGARLWREFLGRMQLQHPKVLFVASAGNADLVLDGENHLPGGIKADNLVTVGAIDNTGKKASFSNAMGAGGEVTVATVGQDVMVGIGPDGKPILGSGTSFAAPQVTGAAALLRAIDPTLDAKGIKDVLANTAAPGVPGKDAKGQDISVLAPSVLGGRILRVANAVEHVINAVRARQDPPPGQIDRA
ncbi:MAG: S8 family serine peptidase, partial [Chloroflexi bacterium]|nr:S8 family serine peptidase [Chloroflexota bacterium]